MNESLQKNEYHVWTVYFLDGTSKKIKITSDETSKSQLENYFGKQISKIDYNWGIHSTPYSFDKDQASDYHKQQDALDGRKPNALHRNYKPGMFETSDAPKVGDTIRTNKKGTEGKIAEINENEVVFEINDGRRLVTPISNVTVIQKLEDEGMQLNEISNEVLAKYKMAAGKSATGADKKGDFETGNKRFKGIVTATKKQFTNDEKKNSKIDDPVGEGSMGGINRCAPAYDVSYEKVLDEVMEKWQNDLNELSVGKLKSYMNSAKDPKQRNSRSLGQLSKSVQGVKQADQKIRTKTGDRTRKNDDGVQYTKSENE